MQEALLKQIAELESELNDLYEDIEHYEYFEQRLAATQKILKKSEDLTKLKNSLDFTADFQKIL